MLLGGAASMWLLSRSGALAQEEYGYESALEIAIGLIIIIVVLLIYFIPSIVAFRRRHPNRWPIFLINLLFGGHRAGLARLAHLGPAKGAYQRHRQRRRRGAASTSSPMTRRMYASYRAVSNLRAPILLSACAG